MEKDSRKNQKIHKNVGLFKSTIERKTRIKIREKENRLGRSLTREEKAKLRHKVTHDFQTQLAVRIGAVSLIGLTFFSAGKMLNEGSGRIEGVSQENDNSVTIQANNFREGLKVVGLGDEGILIVQDENGQDVQITNENVKSIKEQNDLMAQREAERNKIKEDIKSIGSEIIVECLKEQGVDTIFGYPGGAILNVYDALYKHSDEITHILTSHEQGASHAADGYARATGKVGVCFATSGPGATNLVTGIATAYMDSVPMVAITCNVTVPLLGRDSFQEIDIAGVTMPITKHSYIVKNVKDLAKTLRNAFRIAKEGRPGPVLVDVTKDVTAAECEYSPRVPKPVERITASIKEEDLLRKLRSHMYSLVAELLYQRHLMNLRSLLRRLMRRYVTHLWVRAHLTDLMKDIQECLVCMVLRHLTTEFQSVIFLSWLVQDSQTVLLEMLRNSLRMQRFCSLMLMQLRLTRMSGQMHMYSEMLKRFLRESMIS